MDPEAIATAIATANKTASEVREAFLKLEEAVRNLNQGVVRDKDRELILASIRTFFSKNQKGSALEGLVRVLHQKYWDVLITIKDEKIQGALSSLKPSAN
jgi:hypothetical protein